MTIFLVFVSLGLRMVIRNRNRMLHFSNRGDKGRESSLFGTSASVKPARQVSQ